MKQLKLFVYVLAVGLLFGCANKVIPSGGPKDESPPVLLKVSPPQQTVNFSSPEIILTFDEYIQLKDPAKQIVISPPISPNPQITVRKKSVVIELKGELAANTTYNINFSNAIADNNEGIPLEGFQYTFSTGTFIDSLKVKGVIRNALTLKPVEGALAILYLAATPDSLFLKKAPDYFSRSATDGSFEINNIAKGSYRMFALLEKNNNYLFDQTDDMIGFITNTIELPDSASFTINIFNPLPSKQKVKSSSFIDHGKLSTVFARPVTELSWSFISTKPDTVIVEFNEFRDSVFLYCIPPPGDSVQIVWTDNDLEGDTVLYQKPRVMLTKPPAVFTAYKVYPSNNEALVPETDPVITWGSPVITYDTSKVKVLIDSVEVPATISYVDSLQTKMRIKARWKEGAYQIRLMNNAIKDVFMLTNDSISSTFIIPPERSKGSITVMATFKHEGSHVVQLVNEENVVVRQRRLATGALNDTFLMLEPATYRLRKIIDLNGNGKWDPGDYSGNIQPEPVVYYPDPVMVRANWEVELEWID